MEGSKLQGTHISSADLRKQFERDGLELHGVINTWKELGRGSYGSVFEVVLDGTSFAAKEVYKIINSGTKVRDNFLKECAHTSKLRHPNRHRAVGRNLLPQSN